MEGVNETKTTTEMIAGTISALISIAAEDLYRERVLAMPSSQEVASDVVMVDANSVTGQMMAQIDQLKRQVEIETHKRVELIDKVVGFKESLKSRHTKIPDNVLARYMQFFELQDA
jgi:hypothetical protein